MPYKRQILDEKHLVLSYYFDKFIIIIVIISSFFLLPNAAGSTANGLLQNIPYCIPVVQGWAKKRDEDKQ